MGMQELTQLWDEIEQLSKKMDDSWDEFIGETKGKREEAGKNPADQKSFPGASPVSPGPAARDKGYTFSIPPGRVRGQEFAAGNRSTNARGVRSASIAPGFRSSEPGNSGAASLIIEEPEEALTEEDVQLYQIRRGFSDVAEERALDQMERQVPLPASSWEEGDAAALSTDRLFLQLGNHLEKGQVSDTARKEMIILSGTDRKADSGMKLLYPAFTLLQSNPSRAALSDTLDRISRIPSQEVTAEGVRIMARAIRSAVADQDARNAEKDRNNRSRQAKYNRDREKAEQKYDSAKRSAERWRK